jgi:nickel transport protein
MGRLAAMPVWLLLIVLPAAGHELHHDVVRGEAVVVRLFQADGSPFAMQRYRLFRAGEPSPYQVGRSDIEGRIAFVPDRAGDWRLEAYAEDGHGVDLRLSTDAAGAVVGERPPFERHTRLIAGVGTLLGLFGLLALFLKSRRA